MIIYNHCNVKVDHLAKHKALIVHWMGYTSDEVYMAAIDKIIELMVKHDIDKTLHDVSRHKGISPASQEYAARKSIAFNKRYWDVKRAIVLPKNHDIFSSFAVKNFAKRVKQEKNQHREFFETIGQARAWLLKDE